jgi:hypothetical protein
MNNLKDWEISGGGGLEKEIPDRWEETFQTKILTGFENASSSNLYGSGRNAGPRSTRVCACARACAWVFIWVTSTFAHGCITAALWVSFADLAVLMPCAKILHWYPCTPPPPNTCLLAPLARLECLEFPATSWLMTTLKSAVRFFFRQ